MKQEGGPKKEVTVARHEIEGLLRLEASPGSSRVQLVQDANVIINLGWWLKVRGLDGKQVKITVEQVGLP